MNRDRKNLLIFITSIIIIYGSLQILGITCPIKALTGVSCPSCGMTRAWFNLLRLDFNRAFYYHPLFSFPLFFAIIYFFKDKFSKKFLRFLFVLGLLIVFIVYFIRIMDPRDSIVVFRPHESIIYRIFIYLKNLF